VLGKPSTDFIAGCTVAEVPIQECEAVGGDPTTEPPVCATRALTPCKFAQARTLTGTLRASPGRLRQTLVDSGRHCLW
jgi:hypothetical protein